MNWDKNQGPWGGNGKDTGKKPDQPQNPWSGRGPNREPPYNTPEPPDFGALWAKLKNTLDPMKPKGHLQAFVAAGALLFGIWAMSGFYMVAANQVGVVMRFGAFHRLDEPGLRYHLPAPIEEALTPIVTSQNEITVGFRKGSTRRGEDVILVPQESMMLTQDQNVINVQFTVFWRVSNVNDHLFEIREPEQTVKMAAESAMREVIGQSKLQFALTEGRSQIAEDARKTLQELMDEYKAGITVTQINLQTVSAPNEVKAAFQDVVNARLDRERFQNQAAAHVNKVIPEAKGQAAKIMQEAMAYRDQKIAVAKGDADRFKEVLQAYNMSRDVTSKRLYLETMETILGNAQKVITDKEAGTMPLYPLTDLKRSTNQR